MGLHVVYVSGTTEGIFVKLYVLGVLLTSVRTFVIWFKSDYNNGHFTERPACVSARIISMILRINTCQTKNCSKHRL